MSVQEEIELVEALLKYWWHDLSRREYYSTRLKTLKETKK